MGDGVYLYCIAPAGHEPPAGLRGVGGLPVTAVPLGEVAAWVSHADDAPRPSIEGVQRHNAVIERAMSDVVTPVPLRFGQYVEATELESRTADRVAGWIAALADFAGCREYGIRIVDPSRAAAARDVRPVEPSGGRSYLEQLAQRAGADARHAAEAVQIGEALRDAVGPLVVRDRVEPLPTKHGVASIAHLVRIADAAAYARAVEGAKGRWPALRFLTSGPWPPYSFAA